VEKLGLPVSVVSSPELATRRDAPVAPLG